jgi:TonB family protein
MRTLLLLAFAAAPQILGARSEHHDLRVTRSVVSPEQVAYDVAVVDLDSGKTVLKSRVAGKPAEAVEVTGETVRVRLAYEEKFFSATLTAANDELRTWWQLERLTPQVIDAPGAFRVGGEVAPPVAVRRVEPLYPEAARRNGVRGIVVLQVLVGKDGRVKDAVVVQGLPYGLGDSALDSIRKWQFRPATRNGEPVDAIFDMTFSFRTW